MTKAEILVLLKTKEGQEALQEATSGLADSKAEILGEKKKLQSSLEAISGKLSELEAERDTLRKENFSITVDHAVDRVMDAIKVAPGYRRAVKALLRAEPLSVSEKDGERIVTIGKGDKAQPLEAWAAAWSLTDEGKGYVLAPLNSGGGAPGSHEGGSSGFNLESADPDTILKNLPKLTGGKR